MSFRDLQFSLGRLTTDIHAKLAEKNPMQKPETKTLSMWIFNERNNLATMRTLGYQHSETNKMFQQWAKEELVNDKGENSRDIEDIGDKLVKLLQKQVEIDRQYADQYQQYRHAIKSIREREDRLSDIREKKRTLNSRIANLTKTSAKSPKLRELKKELESLEKDTHDTEMEMGDFKRFALREAFYLRFNAMTEYAEKTSMIAGFGKYIVDLLDIRPTPAAEANRRPYEKGPEAALILADAIQAVDDWHPRASDERPTLAKSLTVRRPGKAAHAVSDDEDDVEKGEKDDTKQAEASSSSSEVASSSAEAAAVVVEDKENEEIKQDKADDAQEEEKEASGKGKEPAVTAATTTTPAAAESNVPPSLPPRTPVPSSAVAPTTPYSVENIAATTSDHKDPGESAELTEQEVEALDLYDAPPPPYEDSQQQPSSPSPDPASSPRNSHAPELAAAAVANTAPEPIALENVAPAPVNEESPTPPVPVSTPSPTPSTPSEPTKPTKPAPSKATMVDPTLRLSNAATAGATAAAAAAAGTAARPTMQKPEEINQQMRYEPKEQVSDEQHHQGSPTPSQQSLSPAPTPQLGVMTPHYQQSPASMGSPAHLMGNQQQQQGAPSIATTFDGSMYVPAYHQGQYQQLYNQVQQVNDQQQPYYRPYAEYQQQIQQQRLDAGGFRVPPQAAAQPDPHLSAYEEKKRLAERYAQEEAQARKESILMMKQGKPLPNDPPKKQSVIKPEPEDPGYRSKRK